MMKQESWLIEWLAHFNFNPSDTGVLVWPDERTHMHPQVKCCWLVVGDKCERHHSALRHSTRQHDISIHTPHCRSTHRSFHYRKTIAGGKDAWRFAPVVWRMCSRQYSHLTLQRPSLNKSPPINQLFSYEGKWLDNRAYLGVKAKQMGSKRQQTLGC